MQTVLPRLLTILADRPELEWKFVTLTVENKPSLAESFPFLDRGLKALVHQARMAKNDVRQSRAMRCVVAGVGHIEVKRGQAGEWHPHYHGVWAVDRSKMAPGERHPLSYRELGNAWQAATGSRWIKVVQPYSEGLRHQGIQSEGFQNQLIKDLCEVLKYAVKFEGVEHARDYWEAGSFLRGKTLMRSFGLLRGIKVPEDLRDEPLDWQELGFIDRFFKYAEGSYREVDSFSERNGQ